MMWQLEEIDGDTKWNNGGPTVKDTVTGELYRLTVANGVVTAVLVTE